VIAQRERPGLAEPGVNQDSQESTQDHVFLNSGCRLEVVREENPAAQVPVNELDNIEDLLGPLAHSRMCEHDGHWKCETY